MKCKQCDTEMFIDNVEETENTETFNYKCPNPQCLNYGYKKAEEETNKEEMAEEQEINEESTGM